MFNDLSKANNPGHSAVDDIFAETDKAPEASPTSASATGEIATQKVGLAASNGEVPQMTEKGDSNRWFKWSLIVIVAIIIILSAYLVYSKYLKPVTVLNSGLNSVPVSSSSSSSQPLTAAKPAANNFGTPVATTSSNFAANNTSSIPAIPGVNAPALTPTSTAPTSTASVNGAANNQAAIDPLLDSDSDGLTNVQELALGTNPYAADTDGDNLSDYEELKIYHTDPLNSDTDADGYSDGAEVKSGYNPLGVGKMAAAARTATPTK